VSCSLQSDTEAGKQKRQGAESNNTFYGIQLLSCIFGHLRNGNARSTLKRGILVSGTQRMSNDEFPKKEVETLWAPWRVEYFEKESRDRDFLATAGRASDDAVHLVITRRKNAFLMMNRYPYTVGHLMAVPYRKVAELSALGENEVLELWNLVVHAQALLCAAVKAQGFNIGLNLGECAGAGVPDHLHIHIVPRWTGDTNFMPLIGGARVLSDGLRALYDKLMEAQAKMAGSN
jgi:ATP adenylyltransferase